MGLYLLYVLICALSEYATLIIFLLKNVGVVNTCSQGWTVYVGWSLFTSDERNFSLGCHWFISSDRFYCRGHIC